MATVTKTRPLHGRALLERVAEPLEPAELPRYCAEPPGPWDHPGWYWRPAGADRLEYLGRNMYLAHAKLLELRGAS